MPSLLKPDNRVYFGKGGSGKSYLARSHLAKFPRVLFHDTNCEAENEVGALVTYTRTDLIDRLLLAKNGPVRICWRGHMMGLKDAFEFANEAAWNAGNLVVYWEEAPAYIRSGEMPTWAQRLTLAGRHQGCRVFAAAQRPHKVSRDLTANCDTIYAFRCTEPRDLKYLEEYVYEENAARLRSLGDYHFLAWSQSGAKFCRPIKKR